MSSVGFVETPYEIADLMVRLATGRKDGPVLDTGTGRGVFLRVLLNHGYTDITGIELDPYHYRWCQRLYGDKVRLIEGDFLTAPLPSSYGLITGNPPYVHYNSIPPFLQAQAARLMETREGDLYYAFIRRAVELLAPEGELIYIVPYHFLYNTHAKALRAFILRHVRLEVLIDLDEARLFRRESPETVIFRMRKTPPQPDARIQVLRLLKARRVFIPEIARGASEALRERRPSFLFEYREIPHFARAEPWSLQGAAPAAKGGLTLADIAKVGVGLVSGYDRAFVVRPEAMNQPCLRCGRACHCPLLQPFAKAQHCEPHHLTGVTFYLLIPDSISSEDELRETCPTLTHQLFQHRAEMSRRYLPEGKQWFHWQALRNYHFLAQNLHQKRIYVPTLDRRPYNRFAVGEGGIWPAGDVLFIQPYREEDLNALARYLNGESFRRSYLHSGYRRGGRVVFTQRLLENCPLPEDWYKEGVAAR